MHVIRARGMRYIASRRSRAAPWASVFDTSDCRGMSELESLGTRVKSDDVHCFPGGIHLRPETNVAVTVILA